MRHSSVRGQWLDGRVVMQRTATPFTPVRFRLQPPLLELIIEKQTIGMLSIERLFRFVATIILDGCLDLGTGYLSIYFKVYD